MFYKTKFNLIWFFIMVILFPGASVAKKTNLTINGKYLSVDLQGTSLKAVFETLEKEKGIWIIGDPSLLDKKLSVKFTNHSLEDGIKKILASMNYCLVFDSDGALIGTFLVGKGENNTASVQYKENETQNVVTSPLKNISNETQDVVNSPSKNISAVEKTNTLKVLTNTRLQDTSPATTPEQELESLKILKEKILKDRPSQGAPAAMTTEQIEGLKILSNTQPETQFK